MDSSRDSSPLAEGADRSVGARFADLYAELHRVAKRELARQGARPSLGVTTLLHEAYLDMAARPTPPFPDEARFMSYAARVMRGLIIDHARRGCAAKRGGQFEITAIASDAADATVDVRELLDIGDAIDALATVDPSLAEVVDLKFFCGFSFAEIAAMRRISTRTAQRQWERARMFLHHRLHGRATPGG